MTAPRTVLLAAPRSFCAGVERAIEIVELALAQRGAPVYVRKQIVHNTHVVAELEARGAIFVSELDAVPDGACVVFAAHGVSPTVRRDASARGLDVIDATCPLVAKVHHEARRYAARGDTVILIGHSGHEEVQGTVGEAPDSMVLVESEADVATVEVVDPQRVSYLTQTTLSVTETDRIIAALRQRFPRLRGPASEDICYATSNRQSALADIAGRSQLVLVLGSQNSSNSRRLAELAADAGAVSHLIEDVDQIDPSWLDGVTVVGLTAGASAPPHLVSEVVEYLQTLGPVVVEENPVVIEDISFSLPLSVREPGVTRLHVGGLLLDTT
ncbi:4-hydroxy-3-methylbut-2-enyl diphosphate reductase [Stackebrandtia endophytica]|uniref:4-hydroxy-3-methylbut-2-enyl diphosphate reductase n=1 Tax=Stackebrandtia endophytica TaxID=1496996 RepID=A0A543AZZ4_9ACTN|nr:4-hydroxy-3-methylbut-2-enyl diphosphate reductase [Stackebrandtia endophytica]TQL78162.1 4-hydroxy-3-methylbut-2-enyl diphosphate reductase [Stackebrandtia endophytica]